MPSASWRTLELCWYRTAHSDLKTQLPKGLCCLNVMLAVSNRTHFNGDMLKRLMRNITTSASPCFELILGTYFIAGPSVHFKDKELPFFFFFSSCVSAEGEWQTDRQKTLWSKPLQRNVSSTGESLTHKGFFELEIMVFSCLWCRKPLLILREQRDL